MIIYENENARLLIEGINIDLSKLIVNDKCDAMIEITERSALQL